MTWVGHQNYHRDMPLSGIVHTMPDLVARYPAAAA